MNKLYVGFSKQIELPKGGCLFIDGVVREFPKARIFGLLGIHDLIGLPRQVRASP